jgi:hypothetical protein
MDPAKYAEAGTEHAHQVAVFMWAAFQFQKWPELKWMYAIPNGGERNVAVAARLRAEGVKSGVSDICLPVKRGNYSGLYIEMKKPGNLKGESKNQKEFGAFVVDQGFYYECCDHWEKARDLIIKYMGTFD